MTAPATVLITTKNRKDELRGAIQSALDQSVPVEVLVIDDGSTDGTSEMVRREFPQVRLERSEQSLGLIVQRTRGADLASAPVIVSMDDDAILVSPRTVEQTLADFDHQRIGALAIPYIDVRYGPDVRQRAPSAEGIYICDTYRGTAHALRRDVFRALGGYRGYFFHQAEEGEYCIRMLNAGYVTRLGRADPLHHLESPRRDKTRIYHYMARNNILYAWYNVPMPYFPLHAVATTFNVLRAGLGEGYWRATLHGVCRGYVGIVHEWSRRRPVRGDAYCLLRKLKRRSPVRLEQIEPNLPALQANIVQIGPYRP